MATLGWTLGPFGDARAAYEVADQAGLKLGMTVEELEVYITREWKILKGPRTLQNIEWARCRTPGARGSRRGPCAGQPRVPEGPQLS